MFPGRDPNGCSVIFRVESRRSRNLARIAHCIFVCSSIPIGGLPFGLDRFSATCSYQNGNVFCVQRVAHSSAVFLPKVIVVNFNCGPGSTARLFRKDLAINSSVFCPHDWVPAFGHKFSWHIGTVFLADHKYWFELYEESLFKIITQPIMVRINGRMLATMFEAAAWALDVLPTESTISHWKTVVSAYRDGTLSCTPVLQAA